MKHLLLSLFLFTFIGMKAQTVTMDMSENVVRISPNKDTLYIKDNELGRQIKSIWESSSDSYKGNRPIIIMQPTPSINEKIEVYPPKKK